MKLVVCACATALVVSTAATALAAEPEAREAEAAPADPDTYVAVLAGTTLMHRAPGGSLEGPQVDLNTAVGFGRFVTKSIALELDLGVGFARGVYAGTSMVPGVVWAFHDYFYAAARFVIPVHPQTNFGVMPGLGAIYAFKNGFAPILELNAVSMLARGAPDLGASVTIGNLYVF